MPELVITRGLPGSGKTTFAKAWVRIDQAKRARINRDDFRLMLNENQHVDEPRVTAAQHSAIRGLLQAGYDVIVDDTNLRQQHARALRRLAVECGASFRVMDMTNISAETCVEQDAQRDKPVGAKVIQDLYKRFVKGKPCPLPLPDEPEKGTPNGEPYEPPEGKPLAIIVDIDGTVAICGDRNIYDLSKVHLDKLNISVAMIVSILFDLGYQVLFTTGRKEVAREATTEWIRQNLGIHEFELFMRADGDNREDWIVKLELFDKHIRDNYQVLAAFDDRNQVVDMWRSIGITCLQVAPGDF